MKLPYAKADHVTCSFTVSDENSLSEETTKELVKRHTFHGKHDIICARESETVEKYSKEYFDSRSVGELEEYFQDKVYNTCKLLEKELERPVEFKTAKEIIEDGEKT